MALKALLLRSKLDTKKKDLAEMREKSTDFETREKELEDAIGEMTEDTTEEDRAEVEKQVEAFNDEKKEHEEKVKELEDEISELEKELEKEEAGAPENNPGGREQEREVNRMPERREFFGLNREERGAFFARSDVKEFMERVRECIKEKRALTNVGLTIPDVMLPMLRQVASESSKLMKRVTLKPVKGKARQNIMGTIPEGIWMEMTEALKELDLSFNNVEVDGYKVGGFFAVANSILEDSDENLSEEIIRAIGKAIGKAVDKAIVYGSGAKQPLGFVSRLAKTVMPENYPDTEREWENLSESNVQQLAASEGKKLFQQIIEKSSIADHKDYSSDDITWIMNRKTKMKILSESMGANMNAALVAGMNNVMPIVGGEIEELSFMEDNDIAFGYMDLYLLVERAGTNLGQSEHYKFVEDQTVFRGTARYDGKPVIPEAFGIININNQAPTTELK